jgi:hypothetical protein
LLSKIGLCTPFSRGVAFTPGLQVVGAVKPQDLAKNVPDLLSFNANFPEGPSSGRMFCYASRAGLDRFRQRFHSAVIGGNRLAKGNGTTGRVRENPMDHHEVVTPFVHASKFVCPGGEKPLAEPYGLAEG